MGLENYDPADELRSDIESAIAAQETGGVQEREPEPAEPSEPVEAADESGEGETDDNERERDERGRFKAKGEGAEESAEPEEKPAEAKDEPAAAEVAKVEIRPPPGFSVASKAAWDALPQFVRDDIAKREQEVDNGFKRYAGLGKFAEEAERNGTSLQNAISDYSSIENALNQNFVGGVEYICQRLGVDPRRLAGVMAQRYGVAAPPQGMPPASEPPGIQPAAPFDPAAMARELQQIARTEARAEAQAQAEAFRAQAERTQINSQIEKFGANPKNKFFPNLRQDMAVLVQAGKANNLKEAYEAASWLNPEVRAILINEMNGGRNKEGAAAVSKARNAAKAVGGSPSPGINPDAARHQKDLSLDEEIRAAYDAQVGQI